MQLALAHCKSTSVSASYKPESSTTWAPSEPEPPALRPVVPGNSSPAKTDLAAPRPSFQLRWTPSSIDSLSKQVPGEKRHHLNYCSERTSLNTSEEKLDNNYICRGLSESPVTILTELYWPWYRLMKKNELIDKKKIPINWNDNPPTPSKVESCFLCRFAHDRTCLNFRMEYKRSFLYATGNGSIWSKHLD